MAISIVAVPSSSLAQTAPPPAERHHDYSRYERQTIADVLGRLHLTEEPSPEGKLIERIEVVPLDVAETRDVLPQWVDAFHVTTRRSVVASEVLLRRGDRYQQALVDDTIRNLRRLPGPPQLSAVVAFAAAGSAPGRVVLVVVTKDVWSLRLNWDIVLTPSGLEEAVLQPSETNFLGTHQILGTNFALDPSAYTFGAGYTVPRIGNSRVALAGAANVMVNRQTGNTEGSFGSLVAGAPLYSGTTEWSWDSSVQWQDAFLRRFVNGQLATFVDSRTHERLPFQYHSRETSATVELTRSFGWDVNHDFTLAGGINPCLPPQWTATFPACPGGVYDVPPPPRGVSAQTVQDYRNQYVPVSDTRVGPSLQYHGYEMRFLRTIDFDTIGLQEDYRLGHDVVLRVYPSFHALGSTRDVVGFYGAAQYTWSVRDGLFRVSLQSTTEAQPDRVSDAWILPAAHLATPTIAGVGRIAVDGILLWRFENYLNQTNVLGGGDRLRGYPTSFFVGSSVLSYNVELRSRPVEVLSMQLGGVVFYDVGDAFTGFGDFIPYQSVGFGLRALFPWLDRTVLRADIGFPIERPVDPATGAPIPPFSFIISFGQAFSTRSVAPQPVLPTGQGPDAP